MKAKFKAAIGRLKAAWTAVKQFGRRLLRPLHRLSWLLIPFLWLWRPIRPIWRYLGTLGQALTNILLWITFPLAWIIRQFEKFLKWLGRTAAAYVRRQWEKNRPERKRRLRQWRSRRQIRLARARLFLWRPQPPANAEIAYPPPADPRQKPRPSRRRWALAGMTAALAVVLGAGGLTAWLAPEWLPAPVAVAAIGTPTPGPTATITSTPTPSHTPTPTPTPTPAVIQLTPWPTPNPLAGGGSIVFTMRHNGNSDLYALSIDQDDPLRLTTHPADDRDPAWAPDGRKLAYASRQDGNWDLYVLDLPSGEQQPVTDDLAFDGGPAWSPDGQWLVYESYQNDNLDIYIVKVDGSEGPLRLTQHPTPDFAPVWSPDGRHIAFTSWRTGNKDIFILSLDQLRDDLAVNVTNTTDRDEDAAAFHPQGRYVAYHDESSGFGLVRAQPLNEYAPTGRPLTLGQGRQPGWAPNGDNLVYAHTLNGQDYLIGSSIDAWAVAPQTFNTENPISDPDWSAITFARKPAGYLANIAGTADPPLYEETAQRSTADPPYTVVELPVDAPLPFLSDRVEQSFLALRQRTLLLAGWDPLAAPAQLFQPITAQPQPGESGRSWHKAGRAFDFATEEVLAFSPQIEIVRRDGTDGTRWHAYLRATVQDGTMGEPLRERPWDFRARFGTDPRYYDQGGKPKDAIPTGYYVNFTDLAAEYGWHPAPAGDNWRTYFPATNFWQYEKRQSLTWNEAMRELYPPEQLNLLFGE